MNNNKLNFFIPIDFEKSTKKDSERYDSMFIQGVASDSSKDADGEELEPSGFELDRFLKEGLINYEHLAKTGGSKFIIGEPVEASIKNGKFFIKAKLWKGKQIAEDLWDTLHIMKDNNSSRRLGWSIEGKTLERDPLNDKKVVKAKIHHCAVTFMPTNYNTFADIVKGQQKEDFIEPEYEEKKSSKYIYEFEKCGKKYGITKSFKVEEVSDYEEKAVTTCSSSPLRKESLDSKVRKILQKGLRSGEISPKKTYNFIKSFNK